MSTERNPGGGPPAAADPSLSGLGAAVADADGFPNTAVGTRLMLYQTEEGAVDLRWHIDPVDIAHARAAFGDTDAHAVLRLYHLDRAGDDRLMADAGLGSDVDAEDGLAHYAGRDAEGLLQAEIGLAGDAGGWLLIARSNGLPAAGPVGVAFLRGHHQPPSPASQRVAAGGGALAGSEPAGAGMATTTDAGASGLPEPLRLEPEFPLVEPVLSARAKAGVGLAVERSPTGPPEDGAATAASHRGSDTSLRSARQAAGPLGGTNPQSSPEPPPGGVVPRLIQPPRRRAIRPEPTSPSEHGPVSGSGPLRAAAGDASLAADLVVYGSAPPHTLLNLGGHAYRVGPGGRFVLRIPIREREVIMRVLATLPQLPVAGREDGEPQAPPEG